MQTKIGIIGAMEVEVRLLISLLKPLSNENSVKTKTSGGLNFVEGLLENVPVVIVRSGIGKVNAALCTQRLIFEFKVSHIINTGIAGAIAHGLNVLDFVVSSDALYHDMDATGFGYKQTEIPQMECSDFIADKNLISLVQNSFKNLTEQKEHKLVLGRIASGDQFISSKSIKEKIAEICSPACVEMEGAAIAHAAYLNNIPFIIIRCMSDMADDSGENTYIFNEEIAATLSARLVQNTVVQINLK